MITFIKNPLEEIKITQIILSFVILISATTNANADAELESEFRKLLFEQVKSTISDKDLDLIPSIVEIRFEREFAQWRKKYSKKNLQELTNNIEPLINSETNNIFLSQINISEKLHNSDNLKAEIGIRYWHGKSNAKFDSLSQDSTKGSPSRTENWTNIKSTNIDILLKVSNNNYFLRSIIGGNLKETFSGQVQFWEYFVGQTTGLDVTSNAKEISSSDFYVDIGKDYLINSHKISPFIGFYNSKQSLYAYGGKVNPITSGNYSAYNNSGLTVGQIIDNSTTIYNYEIIISAPRIGVNLDYKLNDFNTLFQLTYMPRSHITLNGRSNVYSNLVKNNDPNIISNDLGIGFSYDIIVNYFLNKRSSIGIGVKYEEFSMKNKDIRYNTLTNGWYNDTAGLQNISIKKYGSILNYQYIFN